MKLPHGFEVRCQTRRADFARWPTCAARTVAGLTAVLLTTLGLMSPAHAATSTQNLTVNATVSATAIASKPRRHVTGNTMVTP